MGCWNKTCGLTGLPIMAGEEVYVVPLLETLDKKDRCYSTAFWNPMTIIFTAEYNDHGGGENSSGIGVDILMASLREHITEFDVGSSEYNDIAIKRDQMDEALFYEAVHEGLADIGGRVLDYTMLRKDVVDSILEARPFEFFNQETKEFDSCSYQEILKQIPKWCEAVQSVTETRYILPRVNGFPAITTLMRDPSNYRTAYDLFDFQSTFANLMEESPDKLPELMEACIKFQLIHNFMECVRKNWAPGGHEGSQAQEYNDYRILISAIDKAIPQNEEDCDEEVS